MNINESQPLFSSLYSLLDVGPIQEPIQACLKIGLGPCGLPILLSTASTVGTVMKACGGFQFIWTIEDSVLDCPEQENMFLHWCINE